MGASFVDMRYPGDLPEKELKLRFAEDQEQDRYENGHSYSGGIGMAQGLTLTGKTFASLDAALDYLQDNAQKWGPSLAVRATDGRKTLSEYGWLGSTKPYRVSRRPNPDYGKTFWLVGAWCAS